MWTLFYIKNTHKKPETSCPNYPGESQADNILAAYEILFQSQYAAGTVFYHLPRFRANDIGMRHRKTANFFTSSLVLWPSYARSIIKSARKAHDLRTTVASGLSPLAPPPHTRRETKRDACIRGKHGNFRRPSSPGFSHRLCSAFLKPSANWMNFHDCAVHRRGFHPHVDYPLPLQRRKSVIRIVFCPSV